MDSNSPTVPDFCLKLLSLVKFKKDLSLWDSYRLLGNYLSSCSASRDPNQRPESRFTPPCFPQMRFIFHRPPNSLQMAVTRRPWPITIQLEQHPNPPDWLCRQTIFTKRVTGGQIKFGQNWVDLGPWRGKAWGIVHQDKMSTQRTEKLPGWVSDFPFEILWNSRRFHKSLRKNNKKLSLFNNFSNKLLTGPCHWKLI